MDVAGMVVEVKNRSQYPIIIIFLFVKIAVILICLAWEQMHIIKFIHAEKMRTLIFIDNNVKHEYKYAVGNSF